MPTEISIRAATEADLQVVLRFIRLLAKYEREPEAVTATVDDLRRFGFGPTPRFHILLAHAGSQPLGMAFYFFNFSTWKGHPGLYLEDLFVLPSARRQGVGERLMCELARIALEQECTRLEFQVLDWNRAAINFYQSLGVQQNCGWLPFRAEGEGLKALALVSTTKTQ